MWAQIRQSDTSLSSGWRGDAPQEIRALQHNSLHDVQSSRFIFCHFFKGLAYTFDGPSRRAYFNFEDSFVSLPVFSVFQRIISVFHHFGGAVCVRTTFYLFQKLFGRP